MNIILLIVFVAFDIKTIVSYQNIQIAERMAKVFKVYWNVPTESCRKHNITFNNLFEKYGIIQNKDDKFCGEKITILYQPGRFPGLGQNGSINGIVPQEGDLMEHLRKFKKDVEKHIPDNNFNGIGIIDFEHWRPILRQNYGTMEPIRVLSQELEKIEHWWWPQNLINKEAQRRFESSARNFLQTTILLAKKLRSKALWGYYGFPECFNRLYNSNPEKCLPDIHAENDRLNWLWSESTVLFPSIYSFEYNSKPGCLESFIKGRISEAVRVRTNGTPILPYFWYRYKGGMKFKQIDLETVFNAIYNSNASGFIIWGSNKDVINITTCLNLIEYITTTLGPAVAKYTKPFLQNVKAGDITIAENETQIDIKLFLNLLETDHTYIKHVVNQEVTKQNKTELNATEINLVDVILDKIASYCVNNSHHCNADIKPESPAI